MCLRVWRGGHCNWALNRWQRAVGGSGNIFSVTNMFVSPKKIPVGNVFLILLHPPTAMTLFLFPPTTFVAFHLQYCYIPSTLCNSQRFKLDLQYSDPSHGHIYGISATETNPQSKGAFFEECVVSSRRPWPDTVRWATSLLQVDVL